MLKQRTVTVSVSPWWSLGVALHLRGVGAADGTGPVGLGRAREHSGPVKRERGGATSDHLAALGPSPLLRKMFEAFKAHWESGRVKHPQKD